MIINKYSVLICALLIVQISVKAQSSQQWAARYDGPASGVDFASSVTVDASGNVYATGWSAGSGTGLDCATIKYNSSGVQQWAARYNGPANNIDEGFAVVVDAVGNVYTAAWSMGSGTNYDCVAIKYNSAGVQQWAQRYNGAGNNEDRASAIAVDAAGNVYITGWSTGSGTNYDYVTIKYNSAGAQQWAQIYNGPANSSDAANSITIDAAGNVYSAGQSMGSGSLQDFAVIKYNSSGVQQWVSRYNGPGNSNDYCFSIAVHSSGNVYAAGQSTGSGTNSDYTIIQYNSAGIQQWVQRYNGPGNDVDFAYSLVIDASGNSYITGKSVGSGNSDYATIKYNSAGVQQWAARYNGPANGGDEAYSIAVDAAGNSYITGFSAGSGTFNDYATIKYNSAGVQQWVQRYNGTGNFMDEAYSIAIDTSGNIYVTGESVGNGTNSDYTTVKYSQLVGVQSLSGGIPEHFLLKQNYPNPFNPITNLEFHIPESGFVSIRVYDITGNEIARLVNEQMHPGAYSFIFDAAALSSGLYFYRLETEKFSETKKMILIK